MIINLPKSGYSVHFREFMSQRAYEAYLSALSKGLNPREMSAGVILNDRVDYAAVDTAVRAALQYVVEQIVDKEGKVRKYSDQFIGDIPRSDFSLLALEITRLKEAEEQAKEEGKKNSGESQAELTIEGGAGTE